MISNRRKAKEIKIGNLKIGGDNPIAMQSMVKTFTSDLSATVRHIKRLENCGCQIVRVAVRNDKDASNLKRIKEKIAIPLVADIHFDKDLAIKAIDSGVDKIRLNPGNIYKKKEVREIARAAKQAHIPIRVGINSGSVLSPKKRAGVARRYHSKDITKIMVNSALDYIRLLEGAGFNDVVVSIKSSDIFSTIQANERIAKYCDYPLHLGVTATGPSLTGIIKSTIVITRLLSEGIGDTIRISLTDRAEQEVRVAYCILNALGLIDSGSEIISCPTCGRCEVDLINIVRELDNKLKDLASGDFLASAKLAVMGCVVNGPGEAQEADLGIAFGKKHGLLFKKGKPIKKVSFERSVDTLLNELKTLH